MGATSRAIVISHSDFGEADRYVQFLTQKWGMITVLAKSARKSRRRYVGGLDLFCHDEISLRGDPKGTPYLTELTVINSFPALRDDLDRVLMAGKVTQWVKRLADTTNPMPEVYSLLGQTLSLIEKESDPERLDLLNLIFKLKLLLHLGLKPSVDECLKCQGPVVHGYFDIEAGGMVCAKCSPGHYLSDHLVLAEEDRRFLDLGDSLRLTQWKETQFPRSNTMRLVRLMTQFAQYHTHLKLPI
jgi:DNA repair protein RecO (recombination protein O)